MLSYEERNLLSVGYKNAVASRRAAWRTLSDIQEREEYNREPKKENKNVDLVKWYKAKIEDELDFLCDEALALLIKTLIPNAVGKDNLEARVFYMKMKGDYYRYGAEFKKDQR
jgi:14-3-3 protein epsilon